MIETKPKFSRDGAGPEKSKQTEKIPATLRKDADDLLLEQITGLENLLTAAKSKQNNLEADNQKLKEKLDDAESERGKLIAENGKLKKDRDHYRHSWEAEVINVKHMADRLQSRMDENKALKKEAEVLREENKKLSEDEITGEQLESMTIDALKEQMEKPIPEYAKPEQYKMWQSGPKRTLGIFPKPQLPKPEISLFPRMGAGGRLYIDWVVKNRPGYTNLIVHGRRVYGEKDNIVWHPLHVTEKYDHQKWKERHFGHSHVLDGKIKFRFCYVSTDAQEMDSEYTELVFDEKDFVIREFTDAVAKPAVSNHKVPVEVTHKWDVRGFSFPTNQKGETMLAVGVDLLDGIGSIASGTDIDLHHILVMANYENGTQVPAINDKGGAEGCHRIDMSDHAGPVSFNMLRFRLDERGRTKTLRLTVGAGLPPSDKNPFVKGKAWSPEHAEWIEPCEMEVELPKELWPEEKPLSAGELAEIGRDEKRAEFDALLKEIQGCIDMFTDKKDHETAGNWRAVYRLVMHVRFPKAKIGQKTEQDVRKWLDKAKRKGMEPALTVLPKVIAWLDKQ